MFDVSRMAYLESASTWGVKKLGTEIEVQTDPVAHEDQGCQSKETTVVSTQTDADDPNWINSDGELNLCTDFSDKDLASFVEGAGRLLIKEMKMARRSTALDNYEAVWKEKQDVTSLVASLSDTSGTTSGMHVTSVAWSMSGAVLAASFGDCDAFGWCTKPGFLCTWRVDRVTKDASPNFIAESPAPLMCTQFHPDLSSIVAGGTFSGQLCIWDLARDQDSLVASTTVDDKGHSDAIPALGWLGVQKASTMVHTRLLTLGADGKLLVWKFERARGGQFELSILSHYALLAGSIPKGLRRAKGSGGLWIGGMCMGMSPTEVGCCMVGSEVGDIFKCQITQTESSKASKARGGQDIMVRAKAGGKQIGNSTFDPNDNLDRDPASPIVFAYEGFFGPCHDIQPSPLVRNAFVACSSDGTVRIYNKLLTNPVISLEPDTKGLLALRWSPVRASVLVVGASEGTILVYDLLVDMIEPIKVLQNEAATKDGSSVYTLRFNSNPPYFLAAGYRSGVTSLWQLSDDVCTPNTPREVLYLEQLLEDGGGTEASDKQAR